MNLVETKVNPSQVLSLTAKSPLAAAANGIREIGLSWDFKDGLELDLDIWVAYLNTLGKLEREQDFLFYNNVDGRGIDPDSKSDVVYAAYNDTNRDEMFKYAREVLAQKYPIVITKDQRDGKAAGFDEVLFINENLLEVNRKVRVAASIYQWKEKNLNFSMVPAASISFPDGGSGAVVYDLQKDENFDLEAGAALADIWKTDSGDIRMQAIEKGGFSKSLVDYAKSLQ